MVTHNNDKPTELNAAIMPVVTRETTSGEVEGPVPPKDMTPQKVQELNNQAIDLVNQLREATGSKGLEMSDDITSLGIQTQRRGGSELELLRARVADLLTRNGASSGILEDLLELRMALNRINPHELSQPGLVRRLFGFIPFAGKSSSALRVLERIAIRHESVTKEVDIIEARLREWRSMIMRDNVELRQLYEQVETQKLPIQKNAYLGELMMERLAVVLQPTEDATKRKGCELPCMTFQ